MTFGVGRCCLLLAILACESRSTSATAPPPVTARAPNPAVAVPDQDLFQPGEITKALDRLLAPLPKPVRILTITVLPSQMVLQVQNAANPSEVHQYSYRNAAVTGPQKVKLLGKGNLKDNLFRLRAADPRVAEEALDKVRAQHKHPVDKLVMIRNLPESMDIQFRVHLRAPEGELVVAADKTGRVLGPIDVVATPAE